MPELDLSKVLLSMDKAYASGDDSWFDYLDENIVVYSQNKAEPFEDKKSYMEYFKDALTSSTRDLIIISRQIRSLGEISVVSQTVRINQDDVIVNVKQTQVWGITDGEWKLNHFHSTFAGTPRATDSLEASAESINVINEKIATMAAVVGVAQ